MRRARSLLVPVLLLLLLNACSRPTQPDPTQGGEVTEAPAPVEGVPGDKPPTTGDGPERSDPALALVRPTAIPGPSLIGEDLLIQKYGAYVLDLRDRRAWQVGPGDERMAWSPLGTTLAVFDAGGLRIIDLPSGETVRIYDGIVRVANWSPNGTQLAFTTEISSPRSTKTTKSLYLIDRTGSQIQKLSDQSSVTDFTWSPTGGAIVFFTSDRQAYLLDLAQQTESLISGTIRPQQFAWSPDGRSFAIGTTEGLYRHDLATGRRQQISRMPAEELVLWSSSTSALLSAALVDGLPHSMVVTLLDSVRGPQSWPIAITLGKPTWSPDAQRLAYISEGCTSGVFDLYVVTDPATRERLTQTDQLKLNPIWSPVDATIIFSTLDALMLIDADSKEEQVLIRRADSLGNGLIPLGWSPDGRFISFRVAGGSGICD